MARKLSAKSKAQKASSSATCSASSLSKKIAKEIMTMNFGTSIAVTVERIAMMKAQKDGSEKALGGRCTPSVERVIFNHLQAAGL